MAYLDDIGKKEASPNANPVITLFLSSVGVHESLNSHIVRTPGMSLIGDRFIDSIHHREQEPISRVSKTCSDNPNPIYSNGGGDLRVHIIVVAINVDIFESI